jgi:hypothetical protein
MTKKQSCNWALGITMAIGVAKEAWDKSKPNHDPSARDVAANAFGAGVILAPACFKLKWSF